MKYKGKLYTKNRFARNMRRLRKSMKLNQTDFGKKLNVSKTSISNYETGKTMPDISTIQKFTEALGINADELFRDY